MTDRRPGEWPIDHRKPDEPEPEHDRGTSEKARVEMVMLSIKADLGEQPSVNTIRAAARRWQGAISAAADEAVRQHRQRHPE